MKRQSKVLMAAALTAIVIPAGALVATAVRAEVGIPAMPESRIGSEGSDAGPRIRDEKGSGAWTDLEARPLELKLGGTAEDGDAAADSDGLAQLPTVTACANSYCRSPDARCYIAKFPEVEWQFCAVDKVKRGLWIENVKLRRQSSGPLVDILYEAGAMEIFVPYHGPGTPRGYDMQFCDDGTTADCRRKLPGPPANWAGSNGFVDPLNTKSDVVVERRDSGLEHLCVGQTSTVRRGSEVVVWALHDPGNYDNIIQYSFRDNGSIGFRAGVTGYNNQAIPKEAHMHNVLWRMDVDLNGSSGDTPFLKRHLEDVPGSSDSEKPFFNGVEGWALWHDKYFTTLVVEDKSVNAYGNPIGYELLPLRTGSARHYQAKEWWTRNDFYVTRYRDSELLKNAKGPFQAWLSPDDFLYPWIDNHEPLPANDNVIWHVSSAHHDPHDEDRAKGDPADKIQGITQIHWSGADLAPHNFFDHNPLGNGPLKCGN